jgi:hypothetical protein
VFVDDEEVVLALRKTILRACKHVEKGRKGFTVDGLARLVASDCRLRGIGRCGGQHAEERDPMKHGDPAYYGSLQDQDEG